MQTSSIGQTLATMTSKNGILIFVKPEPASVPRVNGQLRRNLMISLRRFAFVRAVALNRVYFRQLEEALNLGTKDLSLLSSVAVAASESSVLLLSHLQAIRIDGHENQTKVRESFNKLDTRLLVLKRMVSDKSGEVTSGMLKNKIDLAKQAFEVATQELRKSTGLNVVNFSDVLCAYEKPELCDGM